MQKGHRVTGTAYIDTHSKWIHMCTFGLYCLSSNINASHVYVKYVQTVFMKIL